MLGDKLEEIGQEFDVTRERIRQIEAKALPGARPSPAGAAGGSVTYIFKTAVASFGVTAFFSRRPVFVAKRSKR